MFEKLKKIEQKSGPKTIEKIGVKFLSEEVDRLPNSRRAGGFLLTTFLAMGLALAGAGKAEAQFRGRITGEVFQGGRILASQVMDRERMRAEIKINHNFQKRLREIEAKKNQLEQEFRNERISVGEFEIRKQQLDNEVYKLSRERDRRVANPLGFKGRVLQGVIRGY